MIKPEALPFSHKWKDNSWRSTCWNMIDDLSLVLMGRGVLIQPSFFLQLISLKKNSPLDQIHRHPRKFLILAIVYSGKKIFKKCLSIFQSIRFKSKIYSFSLMRFRNYYRYVNKKTHKKIISPLVYYNIMFFCIFYIQYPYMKRKLSKNLWNYGVLTWYSPQVFEEYTIESIQVSSILV